MWSDTPCPVTRASGNERARYQIPGDTNRASVGDDLMSQAVRQRSERTPSIHAGSSPAHSLMQSVQASGLGSRYKLRAFALAHMNGQRCFDHMLNEERAGLVQSHHHAELGRDVQRPVCLVTGSRAGGSGLDGYSSVKGEE